MQLARTTLGGIEYRIEGSGSKTALILHGGHMNAGIHLGEDYFVDNGYTVIVVSRPGYGNTPLASMAALDDFADALKELFEQLHVSSAVIVGISAGGRTAMRFSAKYPLLVEKLILQSSISFASWPDLKTRIAAFIAFNPISEKYTWKLIRSLLEKNPTVPIKMMVANMTTLDPEKVVSDYTQEQISQLGEVFAKSGSGKGFMNDIKPSHYDGADVNVPTLIIHSKYDKSVPLNHPHLLNKQIEGSQLYLTDAESHLIWFSPHYSSIKDRMSTFL